MEIQCEMPSILAPQDRSLYLAGAFFSGPQTAIIEAMEKLCAELDVECRSPRKFLVLPPKAAWDERKKVFRKNCEMILASNIVLACLDNLGDDGSQRMLDSGTCWEMGFAFAMKRPVVCFSMHQRKMNVMLAQGCDGFLETANQVEEFLKGHATGYAEVETSGKHWDWNWEVAQKWRQEIF